MLRAPAENGLGFFLFMLVNLALFVRPADFVPALLGFEIYQYTILACFAVSFPAVMARFSPDNLEKSPIDVLVLLWFPVIVLSHLLASRSGEAWDNGYAYFKILVYYFLLVSLVTTPGRLRIFMGCLIAYTSIMTLMSALDFHKVIALPRFAGLPGHVARIDETRMYGPGIFQDPNDVCVVIVSVLLLLLARLADREAGSLRWVWLAPLCVFAYGFFLTQSRGGLMALLAGLGVFIRLRWGWNRVLFLGTLGVPVLLAVLGARQLAISSTTNTGQERIQLWNEGLVMFRANPLFGVGQNNYHLHAGQVAHNSYMQAFGDTGFPGGTLFLGAVFLAVYGMYRHALPVQIGRQLVPRQVVDPEYRQIYPFLAGSVAAYAMGMVTLSMNTLVTTYTFLGLASVFIARARTRPEAQPLRFDVGLMIRLAGLAMAFIVGMFLFVRVTFRA